MPEDRQIGQIPNLEDSPVQKGKNWLLVIGIDDYEHHNRLNKAVADAKGFAEVMTTRYGFKHLQPPLYNKEATQRNIRRALGQSKTLGEHDSLIVFYAGHGWYEAKTKLGHIVPTEAENDPDSDFIPTNFITNIFQGVDAKHILLIVDCCFGGSFGNYRDANVSEKTTNVVNNLDKKRSRWVLSSGGIEPVNDGLVFENNSPFMKPFLDVLNSNKLPTVLSNLFPSLREKTKWTSKQMPQYNRLHNLPHDEGELGLYCEIHESDEEKAYKEAIIADDIRVYEKFIRNFPQSNLKAEIRELLKLKRAFVEWTKIKDTDYIERFDGFIHEFEYSPLAQLAQQRIDELDNIKLEKEQATNQFNIEQEEKLRTKESLKIEQLKERKENAERVRIQKAQDKKVQIELQKEIEHNLKAIINHYYSGTNEEMIEFMLEHQNNKAFDKNVQSYLGDIYYYGFRDIAKDIRESLKWYQKAAEQGYLEAQIKVGDIYSENDNYYDAVIWYQKAAEQGSLVALKRLGYLHKNDKNYNAAIRYFQKAANQNDIESQKDLGFIYCYESTDIEGSREIGKFWYQKAAEQGDINAQVSLAHQYMREKNYIEAIKWYQKAAEQGEQYAQWELAKMFREGKGFVQNYVEAIKWYKKSAEQGNQFTQYELGEMYENGYGTEQDYQEAAKWYLKAAEQGNPFGQNYLGNLYKNGYGVPKSYIEAVKWYSKAVEKNHSRAKFNLAYMYEHGKGINQDIKEAIRLYRLAAAKYIFEAEDALKRLGYPE